MNSIYLRLNKIEKRLEGEEFFEGGLSYCFEVEELKSIEDSFFELNDFNVFVSYKEYEQYRKYLEDFNKIPHNKKK